MFAGFVIQYVLFFCCTFLSLYGTPAPVSIEIHVYQSCVTFLLSTAYILCAWSFYQLYFYATRANSWNPDFDLVQGAEAYADEESAPEPHDAKLNSAAMAVATVAPSGAASAVCRLCVSATELEPGPAESNTGANTQANNQANNQANTEGPGPAESASVAHSFPLGEAPSGVDRVPPLLDDVSDVQFYLEVYGYGLVIFVVYYSVDMVVLAPAITLLTGLLVLCARDAWFIINIERVQADLYLSMTMTIITMLLTLMSMAEMLAATQFMENAPGLPTTTVANVVFTYALPILACVILSQLPRRPSSSKTIRRAMPTAVIIAIGFIVTIESVNNMVQIYEASVRKALSSYTGSEQIDYDVITPFLEPFVMPVFGRTGHGLTVPNIIFSPLVKLALTFSVVTGIVNRKTAETLTALALVTGVKELYLETAPNAKDHILRAVVTAACAAFFSAMRYSRAALRCVLR